MMEHLGIEIGAGVTSPLGRLFTSAARTCRTCTSAKACARWRDTAPSTAFAPAFCPNADIFFFELEIEGQSVPHAATRH